MPSASSGGHSCVNVLGLVRVCFLTEDSSPGRRLRPARGVQVLVGRRSPRSPHRSPFDLWPAPESASKRSGAPSRRPSDRRLMDPLILTAVSELTDAGQGPGAAPSERRRRGRVEPESQQDSVTKRESHGPTIT
jgi:hypothetical protein